MDENKDKPMANTAPTDTLALKKLIEARRAEVRKKHEAGLSGIETCRELCSIADDVVVGLFKAAGGGLGGALVALGGYGRGLMNPYSDVDILFLLKDNHKRQDSSSGILASLWDLGLKIGHSAGAVSDTVAMGLADITNRTAMIEGRFLAGDLDLYEEFRKKYARQVIHLKPNDFIRAKIEERDKRHATHGGVALLTEPNVKESRGGLRDFHMAMWVIRAKLEALTIEEMAARGLMDPADVGPVNEAHSTILRIRNSMHWRAGKQSDTLIQSIQPDIARGEGFMDASGNSAAAGLMRKYYGAAKVIDRFASEMIQVALDYKKKRLWWGAPKLDGDGLFASEGKLYANAFPPVEYDPEPRILLGMMKRIAEENLVPSPHLQRGLSKAAQTAPESWFTGESGGRFLIATLVLRHSARALSVLRETGILQRMIPEFSDITDLTQFDMFHRYTTDEHTINTIRKMESLPDAPQVCQQLREICRTRSAPEVIKLALLLHDLGKRAEDHHAVEEDTRTRVILGRLGLSHLGDQVAFLVENHLLMSQTAQRRDFSVPATLRHFCEIVKDKVSLRRLYLLTYADIAGVGPDVWNDWKDRLLLELYERALEYLLEGGPSDGSHEERIEALAALTVKAMGGKSHEPSVREFLASAPERYARNVEPETAVLDIKLVERLEKSRVALRFSINPGDLTGSITIAAPERIGFFATVSGAFAVKNISIVEAQIHTLEGHVALDTLTVSGNLNLFSDPASLSRFESELADLLEEKKDIKELVARRTRYLKQERGPATAMPEPQVIILDHLSETNSVVEIWASDRIGLLYDITRTLARLKLDITSAKISTEGPTAINVFYVTTETGGKIETEEAHRSLRESLVHAIVSPMGEG
ncbi:MAG: [protein-PII] uridylyltransferase [Nitrospinae bacterium]|nr:[protein-PII] uridylyltransferase [Nitrospinota bacterium]MBF0634599.1 [protein-PII] uridylyltransferase [Nitrospinota bacterium]